MMKTMLGLAACASAATARSRPAPANRPCPLDEPRRLKVCRPCVVIVRHALPPVMSRVTLDAAGRCREG